MTELCGSAKGSLFSPLPGSPWSWEQLKPELFLPDIQQLPVQMLHQMLLLLPPAPPAPRLPSPPFFKPLNQTHCKNHSTSVKASCTLLQALL